MPIVLQIGISQRKFKISRSDKKMCKQRALNFSYFLIHLFNICLGAKKNHLIEMVLMNTLQHICFD